MLRKSLYLCLCLWASNCFALWQTNTIGPGKDYPTLATWNAMASTQTVTAGQVAECYGGTNLGVVTMAFWSGTIPSASEYPWIYVPPAERHSGKLDGSGAYISAVGSHIGMNENFSRVTGMRLDVAPQAGAPMVYAVNGLGDSVLEDCLIAPTNNGVSPLNMQVYPAVNFSTWTGNERTRIVNCIVYGHTNWDSGIKILNAAAGGFDPCVTGKVDLVNTTVLNAKLHAFEIIASCPYAASGRLLSRITNCAAIGSPTGFLFAVSGDATNDVQIVTSASTDNSATGVTGVTFADCYVATNDLTPKQRSPLANAGTITTDVATAFNGRRRVVDGKQDIGAIESWQTKTQPMVTQ